MKISDLKLEKKIKITPKDALIIIDVQNDFIPGGALPVEEGDQIIAGINAASEVFKKAGANIVLSQDWHPPGHKSFASAHPGKEPFDEYSSEGIGPVLWPDHCVQNQKGADFTSSLNTTIADTIIQKGTNPEIDSYSAFLDNDKKSETGLSKYLKSNKISRIFVCGLALDFCVYFTAMDGKDLGFKVYFIIDLAKGIDNPEGNISNALETMKKKGIKFLKSDIIQ